MRTFAARPAGTAVAISIGVGNVLPPVSGEILVRDDDQDDIGDADRSGRRFARPERADTGRRLAKGTTPPPLVELDEEDTELDVLLASLQPPD
jgi:hypothetical protein